jgi:hypothetical protein
LWRRSGRRKRQNLTPKTLPELLPRIFRIALRQVKSPIKFFRIKFRPTMGTRIVAEPEPANRCFNLAAAIRTLQTWNAVAVKLAAHNLIFPSSNCPSMNTAWDWELSNNIYGFFYPCWNLSRCQSSRVSVKTRIIQTLHQNWSSLFLNRMLNVVNEP